MAQVTRTMDKMLSSDRLQGVMINIPHSTKLKLQQLSTLKGTSMAALMRHQIMDWLKEYEEKQGEIIVDATTPTVRRGRGRPKNPTGRQAPRYRNFALPRLRDIEKAEGV